MTTIEALDHREAARLLPVLERILREALFLFTGSAWEGRTGGYFCIADGETGLPRLILPVGSVPLAKAEKYLRLCQEKARRLAARPEDRSSWQSRNEAAEQYGGAVRVGNLIYSFSGLPEKGDEALCLAAAAEMHSSMKAEMDYNASRTVALSRNEYWGPLTARLAA